MGADRRAGEPRDGYRVRPWDAWVDTVDLAVPKFGSGVYGQRVRAGDRVLDLDGYTMASDVEAWTAFLRYLVARGLGSFRVGLFWACFCRDNLYYYSKSCLGNVVRSRRQSYR